MNNTGTQTEKNSAVSGDRDKLFFSRAFFQNELFFSRAFFQLGPHSTAPRQVAGGRHLKPLPEAGPAIDLVTQEQLSLAWPFLPSNLFYPQG